MTQALKSVGCVAVVTTVFEITGENNKVQTGGLGLIVNYLTENVQDSKKSTLARVTQ